jgi:hypothetical protein
MADRWRGTIELPHLDDGPPTWPCDGCGYEVEGDQLDANNRCPSCRGGAVPAEVRTVTQCVMCGADTDSTTGLCPPCIRAECDPHPGWNRRAW